jgi:hypothetical protein
MSRPRARCMGAAVALMLVASVQAATWYLVDPVLIDAYGTWPSVWSGTVAYTYTVGGPVMYYDGTTATQVYPASLHNYEVSLANGVIAWRNCQVDPGSNEILRWNGQTVVNISNSPEVPDSDVALGSNGDILWSRDHLWLMYYDASAGTTTDLGIKGVGSSLYITPGGEVTYAYQDPDTHDVLYFDGAAMHVVGPGFGEGDSHNARPAVWEGAVAWIGPGIGDSFTAGEVFFWKQGQTTRVTNDDAVNGRTDDYPSLWNDVVVWQRAPVSAFQTRVFLWDGTATSQLTTTRTLFPSFHGGWVTWVDYASGLYVARVIPDIDGDCNEDGVVDGEDFAVVAGCFTGPGGGPVEDTCQCGDLDADTDVDLADFAMFQALPTDG